MLITTLITMIFTILGWVFSLFPGFDIPSWLTADPSVNGSIGQEFYNLGFRLAEYMGSWIDIPRIMNGLTFVTAAVGFAFAVKGVRMIASFFTGGGGSTS